MVAGRQYEDALLLIKLGLRSSTTHVLTGVPKSQCSQAYFKEHGCSSPSGRKPEQLQRYYGPRHRIHASYILLRLYFARCSGMNEARSLIVAYSFYLMLVDSNCASFDGDIFPLLSMEDAFFLARCANFRQEVGTNSLATWRSDIQLTDCTSCGATLMTEAHEILSTYKCPSCSGGLTRSSRIRNGILEKQTIQDTNH